MTDHNPPGTPWQQELPPGEGGAPEAGSTQPADGGNVLRFADAGNVSGIVKCPRCGSSDVAWDIPTRALTCRSCRGTLPGKRLEDEVNLTDGIATLTGTTVTERAQDIAADAAAVVTLKCTACGAEVVINTDESVQARCHWCRNTLSTDTRVRNGAVPDGVVPFLVTREDAMARITDFVSNRRMFADGRFKKEFTAENVMGVYLPYFVFDGRCSAQVSGEGEIETRRWTEQNEYRPNTTYYEADIYAVSRSFDLTVDDLFLESSSDKADTAAQQRTNNVLNALLPFDVKQALQYSPSYLKGFTSERRDLNVSELGDAVTDKLLTVARSHADGTIDRYDRGVRWDEEKVDLQGSRWATVYLPLWIYSWYEKDTDTKHYVAVNGQSGAVMGSVPMNGPLLGGASTVLGIVVTVLTFLIVLAMLR